MRVFYLALISKQLLFAVSVTSAIFASVTTGAARAQDAQSYLENALQTIETRALNRDKVNWSEVRSRAFSMAPNASKPSDVYSAIVYALNSLNDNHSFMLDPAGKPVAGPSSPGKKKNIRPYRPTQREKADLFLQSKKGRVGFIVVEGVSGPDAKLNEYAGALRKQIEKCRNYGVNGWIIDLRGNNGGNMWPMLVGIGPVIGAGTLGHFVYGNKFIPWYYRQGASGVVSMRGASANFSMVDGMGDFTHNNPIAVLIDRNTLSSGEAVAISLRGRSKTCFLGERTGGLSTANETIKLSDGAALYLTTSTEADRTKQIYNDGIEPDINIGSGNIPAGSANDPVIAAALKWIESN